MESMDDDFGDLYAEVEVQASSAIGGLCIEPEENSPRNGSKSTEADEKFVANSVMEDSYSDDDLNIVLNDDDCGKFPVTRIHGGSYEEDEDGDFGVEGNGSDKISRRVEPVGDGSQLNSSGNDVERGTGAKIGPNSHFKYVRSHGPSFPSNIIVNGRTGVSSFSSLLGGSDREDDVYDPKNVGNLVQVANRHATMKSLPYQFGYGFFLPWYRTILDVNIDAFEEKPWRHPGADITDFFNFGFNEDSWKRYCNSLEKFRQQSSWQARIPSHYSSKFDQAYEAEAGQKRATQEAITVDAAKVESSLKCADRGEMILELPKGRPIQVEDSINERQPSMVLRHPRLQDSDVIIQIPVQDSTVDSSDSAKEDLGHGSQSEVSESGKLDAENDKDVCFSVSSSIDELYGEHYARVRNVSTSSSLRRSLQPASYQTSPETNNHREADGSDMNGGCHPNTEVCISKGIAEAMETKNKENAPSGKSLGDPTFTEASHQMLKTAEDVHVALRPPLTRDDQPQLLQINANPDPFGCGNVSQNNSNPFHEQVELVSSPGGTNNGSFLHGASSNPHLMQPIYSGFEGNDSSLGHDAIDAHQTTSSIFSPLIMEPTHSFPWALAEKIPQNGSYSAQSFYPEHEVNSSGQQNQLNVHIGSSFQTELQGPQRVGSVNRGKGILFADQFEQNHGNNNSNDNNQQALPFTNLFPQSTSGFGFPHGGSTQINQQAPLWVSNKENGIYRPLAPSGSQVDQFKATSNSDSQCYNFMVPISSAPTRPQQLNNPLQLLNGVPNTPNASNSLLQHSVLTKYSMPLEFMPQHFSYQHDQVSTALGAYNSQNCSTRLAESSMPLRTPMLPPHHQLNPFDASDLQYRNSWQSKAPMLSSGGFIFENLSGLQPHQFDQPNLITNLFGTQCSTSLLQESLLRSGSNQLPGHQQQASSQFSMMPSLPNSKHHNSNLAESSILPRLPTVQQQGLLNQTARPVSSYPSSGTSLSSIVLNSLLQQETGDTSAPPQLETSLSRHKEQGTSGRRRGHTRTRFELGESSSFKRFRGESTMPQASTAEPLNRTFFSLQNEASSSANTASLSYPRQIKNSVYDPIFEGIGLPIDPHLRMFASYN